MPMTKCAVKQQSGGVVRWCAIDGAYGVLRVWSDPREGENVQECGCCCVKGV